MRGGTRPGAGRPPKGPDARTTRVTIRFSPEEAALITRAADAGGLPVAEWIRQEALRSAEIEDRATKTVPR